jgi:creatinine amidohydrolase/Fe(II)-dependent formamide hydrolase-like protein
LGHHGFVTRTATLLLGVLFLWLGAAHAAGPPTVYMGELTWTEVRDALQAGRTTVIVPIGGTEQSGPHMALNKHNLRVRFFAGRVAAALGDALVAPVLAFVPEGGTNPPTGHMRFPGTITIPESTFEEILLSAGRGFKSQGFRDVVFLGDHGGYQKLIKKSADKLNREWAGTPVRAHAVEEYYVAAQKEYVDALKAKGFTEEEIGTHAGLADTSLMLAIDPSLVRVDRIAGAGGDKSNGVSGDPMRSTSALGKIGVDIVVKRTVEAIKREVAEPRPAPQAQK